MKQTVNAVKMYVEPLIPSPDGEAGVDFCQVCGSKTKFIGGPTYDVENYECKDCKALHIVKVEYHKGKAVRRSLEAVY